MNNEEYTKFLNEVSPAPDLVDAKNRGFVARKKQAEEVGNIFRQLQPEALEKRLSKIAGKDIKMPDKYRSRFAEIHSKFSDKLKSLLKLRKNWILAIFIIGIVLIVVGAILQTRISIGIFFSVIGSVLSVVGAVMLLRLSIVISQILDKDLYKEIEELVSYIPTVLTEDVNEQNEMKSQLVTAYKVDSTPKPLTAEEIYKQEIQKKKQRRNAKIILILFPIFVTVMAVILVYTVGSEEAKEGLNKVIYFILAVLVILGLIIGLFDKIFKPEERAAKRAEREALKQELQEARAEKERRSFSHYNSGGLENTGYLKGIGEVVHSSVPGVINRVGEYDVSYSSNGQINRIGPFEVVYSGNQIYRIGTKYVIYSGNRPVGLVDDIQ